MATATLLWNCRSSQGSGHFPAKDAKALPLIETRAVYWQSARCGALAWPQPRLALCRGGPATVGPRGPWDQENYQHHPARETARLGHTLGPQGGASAGPFPAQCTIGEVATDISEHVTPRDQAHVTRQHDCQNALPHCNTKLYQRSFFIDTTRLWNQLPPPTSPILSGPPWQVKVPLIAPHMHHDEARTESDKKTHHNAEYLRCWSWQSSCK